MVVLTGRRARDLPELLRHLREVNGSSIFYHTHQLYLSHHFEKPRFYNDFANWVGQALQEPGLAERLAAIDLLTFTTIRQLREAIIEQIEQRCSEGDTVRHCRSGEEFHFCQSKSFIMPTGVVAGDPPDFFEKLPAVSNVSLYFHFFEARLRLGNPTNDFSQWLAWRGEEELARAIDRLNPYILTLDELKERIIELGRRRGGS